MNGKIGVLYQDKEQVGGFYNWDLHISADYTTVDGWKEYKPTKHIRATAYWLVSEINGNCFDAEFYRENNGQLVLMDAGQVSIDLPDIHTLDGRLDAVIDIRWIQGEY